jgi:hypothetical protein
VASWLPKALTSRRPTTPTPATLNAVALRASQRPHAVEHHHVLHRRRHGRRFRRLLDSPPLRLVRGQIRK